MTTRSALAGAACALLALAPASLPAQADAAPDVRDVRDALVAPRPAAPATVVAAASPDALPARPNATVVVAARPSYGRYAVRGTAVGTAVGLVVGVLAYRNNQRKCHDCVGNDAIPVLVTGAGSLLGFVAGNVLWFARDTRDLPEPAR